MVSIEKDVEKILISKEDIAAKVKEMAREMDAFYGDKEVVLVCILKGSVTFFADLAKELSFPVMYDFMRVSSYGNGSVSGGNVKILQDLSVDIAGKHVLVVEDILDTGNTLSALFAQLSARNPASLKLCAFDFNLLQIFTLKQMKYFDSLECLTLGG